MNDAATTLQASEQPQILITGLSKRYETRKTTFEALKGIELTVPKQQFISILGPSGCGKSTLLRILAGLEDASDGEISVEGNTVLGPGADRGMVFQGYTLFPWLTVRQNIEYGPKLKGLTIFERRRISDHYLRIIRLEKFANAFPKELSGGMKQRVAIARALANKPKVLLMDEPFGALDAQTKLEMQEMLLDVWVKEKTTVVFITHDIDEAIFLSQRVLVMGANPGRITGDFQVALPEGRSQDVKELFEFIQLKKKLSSMLKHH
ncbi:ABC transporter ATP-binding protein [Paenibacillus swuensis]|uniref:ABC transporter ATP-binding protein n=1 Tax=Paenibacillus swuensis TaxID=1178515 RepID=A0A172TGN3_9BACL|nr:ABC transporter ATP-binding protein [Paenibacillus swuensis]ANE46209.1 ABC transporter ATP-binding protein [Paenibacillus swuensis]